PSASRIAVGFISVPGRRTLPRASLAAERLGHGIEGNRFSFACARYHLPELLGTLKQEVLEIRLVDAFDGSYGLAIPGSDHDIVRGCIERTRRSCCAPQKQSWSSWSLLPIECRGSILVQYGEDYDDLIPNVLEDPK